MDVPRLIEYRYLLPICGMIVALFGSATARAAAPGRSPVLDARGSAQPSRLTRSPEGVSATRIDADEDADEEEVSLPPALVQVVRHAQILLVTMAGAPPNLYRNPGASPPKKYPPPVTPVPLVVKAPIIPQDTKGTPGNEEPPKKVPEPGTLASGVVGTSLALAAWLRKRRRVSAKVETTEAA